MIHFIIGTKAQFIKMAPLMYLLDQAQRPYRVLNLGQHAALTEQIIKDFSIRGPMENLIQWVGNVDTYGRAARWATSVIAEFARPHKRILRRCFADSHGIALLHGDTASTFLGLHLARRAGLKTGLVEAGLSSGKKFDPFPEELIRRHCEKHAELLFTPGTNSAANLAKRKLRGEIIDTRYNTGRDALSLILKIAKPSIPPKDAESYSIMTLHRLETLANKAKLNALIIYAVRMAQVIGPIRFFLHNPTRNALSRHRLLESLAEEPNISLFPLHSYPEFVSQLFYCRYLLTDGGSIQEEASYLQKPCLILRNRTERHDGLGASAQLATYDVAADSAFLKSRNSRCELVGHDSAMKASELILNRVLDYDSLCAA